MVGSIATQDAGAASEMPCVAPPIRLYPAGTATAELDADGLAVGLLDTVADADGVAEAAGFAVPGALPHDVTAMPIANNYGHCRVCDLYVHHLPPFLGIWASVPAMATFKAKTRISRRRAC